MTRVLPIVDASAPPERLAAFRVVVGIFTTGYLAIRLPVMFGLAGRDPSTFAPVGVMQWLNVPPPDEVIVAVTVITVIAGCGVTVGWRHRVSGPLLALGMLFLATLRSSWGQMLHFEHAIVLHTLIVGFAPAADAWSFDARRRAMRSAGRMLRSPGPRYGWPLAIAGLITVMTYAIAGVAKVRYGGADWVSADVLRHHIAYTATRAELLGGDPAPLARLAIRSGPMLGLVALASVSLELGAPLALLGNRLRNVWVAATWMMHVGIVATMWVGFPVPLWGVAFAPLFALERIWWEKDRWLFRGERSPAEVG